MDPERQWGSSPPRDGDRLQPESEVGRRLFVGGEVPERSARPRYELLFELARGGMATVYVARQRGAGGFERIVAIKRMHSHLEDVAGFVEGFMSEARVASLVHHPNVVGVLDVDFADGQHQLVMDYVEGVTLSRLVRESKKRGVLVPTHVAARICIDVLRGLHAAHEQCDIDGTPLEIVHRDATPHNILVDTAGVVRLTDFGIARALYRDFETTTGIVKGKARYMSPEQAKGHVVDRRTDVFAIGVVLWELLAARPLFVAQSEAETLLAVVSGNIPSLGDVAPDVAEPLRAVVDKALAYAPDARFSTALEFAQALETAAERVATAAEVADLTRDVCGSIIDRLRATLVRVLAMDPVERTGVLVAAPELQQTDSSALVASRVDSTPTTELASSSGSPKATGDSSLAHVPAGSGQQASHPSLARASRVSRTSAILMGIAAFGAGGAAAFVAVRRGAPPKGNRPAAGVESAASIAAPAPAASPVVECPADMASIPAGSFFMGSPRRDATESEMPAHLVRLGGFCMDLTEVTVEAYERCSTAGECLRADQGVDWPGVNSRQQKTYDPVCNAGVKGRETHPINCVSWEMADRYCDFVGKRLPTEAEWEYTARGRDGRAYPWGDEMPAANRLNACGKECAGWGAAHGVRLAALYDEDDGFATTAPVGSFPAGRSTYGPLDLTGNVWEWVADWYGPYDAAGSENPHGPATGEKRAVRGGSWNGSDPAWVRPSYRYAYPPKARSHGIGFRCARSIESH